MKKRLLVFHRTIAPYRIDFFNDLYKSFDARICLSYRNLMSQKFDYDKILEKLCFRPIYLNIICRFRNRVFNSGYWEQLDDFKPDIVFVSEFGVDCIVALIHRFVTRQKYKIVSICDDSHDMVVENNDFSRFHKVMRKWAVPHIDELILVEPKVVEWYQTHYGKGICFPIIKKEGPARAAYEHALRIKDDMMSKHGLNGKRVFLFVGRLVTIKNVDMVIDVFAMLPEKDNVLVIVGDGPERERLTDKAKQTKRNIIFTGRLEGDSLNVWYDIADCFVLASFIEPFGAVTNEALLAGCYVLISEKAGSKCLVKDGVNGYTFDPVDTNGLYEKMKRISVLESKQSTCVLRPSKMTMKYEDVFNNLIERLN